MNMRENIFTVEGSDGIHRSYDEHYDCKKDVEQDPNGAWFAIQTQSARIDKLEKNISAVIARYDEYRADEYEVGLHGVDTAIHHARAALKEGK